MRGGERALKSREDPWFSAFTKRVPTGRVKMVPEARSGVQGRKRGGRGSEPGGRVAGKTPPSLVTALSGEQRRSCPSEKVGVPSQRVDECLSRSPVSGGPCA